MTPPAPTPVIAPADGDDTRIDVRLVVAPAAGRFQPAPPAEVTTEGEVVARGAVLGHVHGAGSAEPVRSFCAGFLIRFLAESGERVRPGQPVAWLHPVDRPATRPSGDPTAPATTPSPGEPGAGSAPSGPGDPAPSATDPAGTAA